LIGRPFINPLRGDQTLKQSPYPDHENDHRNHDFDERHGVTTAALLWEMVGGVHSKFGVLLGIK
jgi:hypothetical protein